MGFYEDDRIRSKQRRFITQEAEKIIAEFRLKGLSDEMMIDAFKVAQFSSYINETEKEIYQAAILILES